MIHATISKMPQNLAIMPITILITICALFPHCLRREAFAQIPSQQMAEGFSNSTSINPIFEDFREFQQKETLVKKPQQALLADESLYHDLLKAEIEYGIANYHHRQKVFNWNHTSSVVIFWVVISIVAVGLFFSGVQFYISLKRGNATSDEHKSASNSPESVTEFEASLSGVKIRSSILGIIILVISLAFFYLYLIHVYPVSETRTPANSNIKQEQQGSDTTE